MSGQSRRNPLNEINRLIRENRVADYASPNLALGMQPIAFSEGKSRWRWGRQPETVLNPFGTIQGGYLAVFIDEILGTAIASVLEEGEWAMTAEFKLTFLRVLTSGCLEGSGSVIRRTRALAFVEAKICGAAGAVAVAASSTWAVARH